VGVARDFKIYIIVCARFFFVFFSADAEKKTKKNRSRHNDIYFEIAPPQTGIPLAKKIQTPIKGDVFFLLGYACLLRDGHTHAPPATHVVPISP